MSSILVFNANNIIKWKKQLRNIAFKINSFYEHDNDYDEVLLQKLTTEQRQLDKNIDDATLFLANLHDNPKLLVNNLVSFIEDELDTFDCNAATKQSQSVRQKINKIRLSLKIFLNNTLHYDARQWQLTYLKIHGLLSLIYNDITQERRDKVADAFLLCLIRMLNASHIDVHDDLPDDLAVGKRSYYFYKEKCRQFSQEELDEHEIDEFHKVMTLTRSRFVSLTFIAPQHQCRTLGLHLLDRIEHEKMVAEANNKPFDIKYATTIIKKTNELLDNPENSRLQRQYRTLADQHHQSSSLRKQVGGIILALLGIALIIGSIALIPATLGLSTTGIALSSILIAKGCTAAIGIAGAASGALGVGFFAAGQRRGLSKTMVHLATKAEESPVTSKTYAKPLKVFAHHRAH